MAIRSLLPLWVALLSACQFTFDRTLEPGELRGTVVVRTDAEPVPAAGARVLVEGSRLVATSDAKGRFVLRGLPEGTYSLRIAWDGPDADAPVAGLVVRDVVLGRDAVKGLEGRDLGRLVIAAFGAIEGVVRQSGEPVEGARVAARGGAVAVSDAQGRFRLPNLTPGDYAVVAEVADGSTTRLYASVPTRVAASSVAEINVVLEDLSPASPGHVRGAARQLGNPDWAAIAVTLERPLSVGVERLVVGQTDADGEFESSAPMPPGVWTLLAQAPDGAAVRVSPFIVNGDTDAGRLLLPDAADVDDDDGDGVPDEDDGYLDAQTPLLVEGAGGSEAVILVVATNLAGEPAKGVEISFTSSLSLSSHSTTTNADGRAQVRVTLPPMKGQWPVVATRAGADPVVFLVRVTTVPAVGFVVEASSVITVGEPVEFTLKAVDALGLAATDYRGVVTLETTPSTTLTPSTHAFEEADEGALTVQALFPSVGNIVLKVTDDGSPALEDEIELKVHGGDAVELVLEPPAQVLPGAPSAWTVRLRDAEGNTADRFEGSLSMRSTDARAIHPGKLAFSLADEGEKQVDVTFRSSGAFEVEVSDGAALQATENVTVVVSAPAVEVVPPSGEVSGVVELEVVVTQAESLPVDLELEFERSGMRRGLTQARGYVNDGTSGRLRLGSSPSGVAHRLRWDTVFDVGSDSNLTIFASPSAWGVEGTEASTASFYVTNEPSLLAPQPLTTGVSPQEMVLADLDGDGLSELVFCGVDGSVVVTSPDPLRPLPTTTLLSGRDCGKLATFDVDSDGQPDLVLMDPTAKALVVLDVSDGTFTTRTLDLSATGTPVDFAMTHLDADGEVDFAVVYAGVNGVWLHRSDAASGWQPGEQLSSGETKSQVAWADLNRDGEPDLLAMGATVEAWRNTGGGSFFSPYEGFTPLSTASGNPVSMVVADLSGDLRADVVIGTDEGTLAFFRANGDGAFNSAYVTSLDDVPSALVPVDFDQREGVDLVASYASTGKVQVLRLLWDSDLVVMAERDVPDLAAGLAAGFVRHQRAAAVVVGAGAASASVLFGKVPVSERIARQAPAVALPGREVKDIEVADVDGDGRDDLLAATSGRPALMLGAGDAHFEWSQERLENVADVSLVRAGDVDGDGRIDVVLVETAAPRVGVQRGSAAGMQPAVWTQLSSPPVSLVIADLDKDGRDDVVALDGDGTLAWLRSAGDGSFEAPVLSPGPALATKLVVRDFNGDGLMDAAVLDADGLRVMAGQGDGSFAPMWTLPGAFSDLALADFNGDGRDDWLLARGLAGDAVVYAGSATGPTTTVLVTLAGRSEADVVSVDAADANGDGTIDVVMSDRTGQVRFYGNAASLPSPDEFAVPSPGAVTFARLAEASSFQIVVASGAGGAHVLDNRDGSWRSTTLLSLPAGARGPVFHDVNDDGLADLCVGNDSDALWGWQGFASYLSFSPEITPSVEPARWLAVGRFNALPRDEVVVGGGSAVRIHASSPTGLWDAVSAPVDFGRPLSGLAAGDVNGDGFDDVLAISSDGFLVTGISNRGLDVSERDLGFVPTGIAVADLNEDRLADVVLVDGAGSRLVVYDSDGVTGPRAVSLPSAPRALAAADLDHDGTSELVVGGTDGVIRVLRRSGDGSWTVVQSIEVGEVRQLAVADLDLDGWPDVAASLSGAGAIVLLHGQGGGELGALEAWGGPMQAGELAVGRINDDEIPDLVVIDEQTGDLVQLITELEASSGDSA